MNLFFYIATETFEATMKITGGNFSTYTLALDNKTSPKYKELKYEIISAVRTCIEFNGHCSIVALTLVNCTAEVSTSMLSITLTYR